MACDTSAVFHIDMLDAEHHAKFNPELPWLFDSEWTGVVQFKTEHGACLMQREYRRLYGFDEWTGERITPVDK